MSNRPSIPAEIAREVLIECGHRCAVCGAGCPLERAHIIPWHKSKEHKAEDLICLCANCHQRADLEKWGEKTLREYKQRPWVMRQYERTDNMPEPKAKVHIDIDIDMELDRFDERFQRLLQSGLAGFLEISPNSVRITSMGKGSVKVTIELPAQSAERLMSAYQRSEPELARYLDPLVVLDLHRAEPQLERIQPEEQRLAAQLSVVNQVGIAVDRANLQAQELRAAILEERQHMALQMHDDIAHTLIYLGLRVESVMGSPSLAQNIEVQAELEGIRKDIEDSYKRVCSFIRQLREDVTGHFDLEAALPKIISQFEKLAKCRVELQVDKSQLSRLSSSVVIQAYFIICEALLNVMRHSGADSVQLTLQGLEAGGIEVTIQDNGRGFDLDGVQQSGRGGGGLRMMRERAERVGGSLRIESQPGQGTRAVISLPSG